MQEIELSLDGDLNLLKGGHLTFEITDDYIEVSGYIPEPKEVEEDDESIFGIEIGTD